MLYSYSLGLACGAILEVVLWLSTLRTLQVLYAAGNRLSGSLAPLESCTALRDLDLANNLLTGSLEPLQVSTSVLVSGSVHDSYATRF